MAYGRTAAKKSPTALRGGQGSRAAEASGPDARACVSRFASPGGCVSRLRGLSSSILVLAFRRPVDFEAGLRTPAQSPCEPAAQPTRRRLAAYGTHHELWSPGCQENLRFFRNPRAGLGDCPIRLLSFARWPSATASTLSLRFGENSSISMRQWAKTGHS
jgi:hypothetical protein